MRNAGNTRKIRLLALDVDGTLLNDRHRITTASRKAVQRVAQIGVQVLLASARSPSALRSIIGELDVDNLVISYTGALTCRLTTNPALSIAMIAEQRMNLESAHFILRNSLARRISVGWFSGNLWYIPTWDSTLQREAEIVGIMPIEAPDLAHFTEAPHKLHCISEPNRLNELLHLEQILPFDCMGQFSHTTYLEITQKGVDKASSLLKLGQQLGISLAEMAAIGDGANDITMLREVGIGIAMGNAPLAVRAVADWVTETNNLDGVARAIEWLQATGSL